jgi:cytochrome c-type biogenesis protein
MTGALGLAFLAGLLSFATPCVLPLVPAYLAVVAGVDADALAGGGRSASRRVVASTVPFVVGLTTVFVAVGAGLGLLGQTYAPVVTRASAIVIVAMGFAMAGLLPLPFLERAIFAPGDRSRRSPLLLGGAFACAAAPCVGPVLGSVLALASRQGTVARGSVLLAAYALGLGLPFFAVGGAYGRTMGAFRWLRDRYAQLRVGAGVVLVAIGLALYFDRLGVVRGWADHALSAVGLQ